MIIDKTVTTGWGTRGTGFTVTDGVIRVVSPDTTTQYFKDLYFPIEPNMEITIECEARVISGAGGFIGIDTFADYTCSPLSYLDGYDFTDNEWTPIKCKLIIPANNSNIICRVSFGVRTAVISTVEFRNIKISRKSAENCAKPELVACGMIKKLASSSPVLHTGFPSFGVTSIVLEDNNTIKVTIDIPSVNGRRPLVIVNGSCDNFLIPCAGQITEGNTTYFRIRFSNGTAFQDISAVAVYPTFFVYI